jgi:hypothetical protein
VREAEEELWSERGAEARDYLARRGLQDDTIRAACLGCLPQEKRFEGIFLDRPVFVPSGIIIPWFDGPTIVMINVRRAEGAPKYMAVRGSRRGGLFPGPGGIVNGRPVIIVEGEFDALLLGQELRSTAAVVTLGGASTKASPRIKNALLGAHPWIIACDADPAGEGTADSWLAQSDRCIRVVPRTGVGKDWTEAHQNGLGLRDWWRNELGRVVGRDGRETSAPEVPVSKSGPSRGIAGLLHVLTGVTMPDPPYSAALAAVGFWPIDWRLRWGALTNSYCHQGVPWWDAEARAAEEVSAERDAANGGPPPVMDPDPETALWRDFLEEFIDDGGAARALSGCELMRAQELLLQKPLDREAIRAVVLRGWSADPQRAGSRILRTSEDRKRWACGNPYCLRKGTWWKSVHGVVNCGNCRPSSFPWLVAEKGDASNAPFVESAGEKDVVRQERASKPSETKSCHHSINPRQTTPNSLSAAYEETSHAHEF